jgi:drug/metabolite transporter (DMT)-like permease
VLGFSLTFPAMHVALEGLSPLLVGAGRSVVAAAVAALCLKLGGAPMPKRQDLQSLAIVACCVGFGFGLLSALALPRVGVAASGVASGLLPIGTAVMAVWRVGERPSRTFWVAGVAGSALVVAFLVARGGGGFTTADLLLLAALILAALGYAEGGRLSMEMPGWQVICWALLFALPVTVPIATYAAVAWPPHASPTAWSGFLYLSLVSVLFGFFAWNRGLALAGIARASQVQLAQPLLTVAWAALFFGEPIGAGMLAVALGVIACVGVTQWARIQRPRSSSALDLLDGVD